MLPYCTLQRKLFDRFFALGKSGDLTAEPVLPETIKELAKQYVQQIKKTEALDKSLRKRLDKEGVFDDSRKIKAAVELLPPCYLRFNLYERYFELNPGERTTKSK